MLSATMKYLALWICVTVACGVIGLLLFMIGIPSLTDAAGDGLRMIFGGFIGLLVGASLASISVMRVHEIRRARAALVSR